MNSLVQEEENFLPGGAQVLPEGRAQHSRKAIQESYLPFGATS